METVIKAENLHICYKTGDFREIGLKEWTIRRLTGNYHVNRFMAVNGVSFEIHKGEMVGIIGANGAGKSTLLKVLAGIMAPTEGTLSVKGRVSALLELGSGFDGNLTVRENTYLRGALLGYSQSFMDAKYDEIISYAELEDFQERRFSQLSSGMQARLAFSIASLVKPDILILDEVLSVGDGSFQEKSAKTMMEIINGGAATILVTHALQQVRDLCGKALWLHQGRQMAFGEANEVCDRYESMMNNAPAPKKHAASAAAPVPAPAPAPRDTVTPSAPRAEAVSRPAYAPNEPVFFGDKFLLHTVDGQRAFLDPDDLPLTLHMMEHREWKPQVKAVIAASLTAGGTFVDVGANVGLHSMYAAGFVGRLGKVIAIEPNPSVMKLLKTNMAVNGFDGWTTFVQKAVSNFTGRADFYVYEGRRGEGSFMRRGFVSEIGVTAIKVDVDTLRSIVPVDTRVDLLKIDAQGFEPEALRGAGDLLDQAGITVIAAWTPLLIRQRLGEPALDEMLNLLREKGFRLYCARYTRALKEVTALSNDRIKSLTGEIVCTGDDRLERLCG